MRQAVEQNHVHAARALGAVVHDFVERVTVLALEVNFGARARRVAARDFRKSGEAGYRWRDVDCARVQLEESTADARTAEYQRRPALHDVERAMLPRLDAVGVALGADDEVGRTRTVEELRDSLVRVRMAQNVRLEERAIGVVGAVAAARGGLELLINSGDDERILISDGVLADLFDHLERQRTVGVGEAFESNHPASRPYFVRVRAPRDHKIDEVGGGSLGQQREDGRVAGIVLMRIESLATAALGSMLAQIVRFGIHLFSTSPCQKNLAPRGMTSASQLQHTT